MNAPAPPPRDKAAIHALAGGALNAAIGGDADGAASAVLAIDIGHGRAALSIAVHAWADTLNHHFPERGERLEFTCCQGHDHDAGDFDPPFRWAAQFIHARALLDPAMTNALMAVVLDGLDDDAVDAHVGAVLDIAARNLRRLLMNQAGQS